jgi:D-glycerate 3-kinase
VQGHFDLILFEGWCVATPAQHEAELREPVNALEADEDSDGRWRRHVNDALRGAYAEWFSAIDRLIFLQVPDFGCVRRWRGQQERETAARAAPGSRQILAPAQLERFIQHYERLTGQALQTLPRCADRLIVLDAGHRARLLPARHAAG